MLDFSKLRTHKGAMIVIHLEDESHLRDLKVGFYQRTLEKKLRLAINNLSDSCGDTGKGTKVHVLINSQGFALAALDEDKFKEWEQSPKKDWHRGQLKDDVTKVRSNEVFAEPTNDQVAKYRDNPIAQEISQNSIYCSFCLRVDCKGRSKSFNETLFDQAIANLT